MRFAWKVTLASLCILVLSIGMGSHLLISIPFRRKGWIGENDLKLEA